MDQSAVVAYIIAHPAVVFLALEGFVKSHPELVFLAGIATTQRLLVFHYAILGILKVPVLRRIFFGRPDEVLPTFNAYCKEVKDDLDAIKASQPQS